MSLTRYICYSLVPFSFISSPKSFMISNYCLHYSIWNCKDTVRLSLSSCRSMAFDSWVGCNSSWSKISSIWASQAEEIVSTKLICFSYASFSLFCWHSSTNSINFYAFKKDAGLISMSIRNFSSTFSTLPKIFM